MAGEIKKQTWEELKSKKRGSTVDTVTTAKRVGCTVSYMSQLFKHAFDCEFLKFNKAGDYIINKIPKNYEDFKAELNNALYSHRERVAGSRGPKRSGQQRNLSSKQIEKLEVNEKTIVPVIQDLLNKSKKVDEMEEKMKKLMKYTKKLKKERDAALSQTDDMFEDIDEVG